jgi:hypothetical protein
MISVLTDDLIGYEIQDLMTDAIKNVFEDEKEAKEYVNNLKVEAVITFHSLSFSFKCDLLTYNLFCKGFNKTLSEASYKDGIAEFRKYFD